FHLGPEVLAALTGPAESSDGAVAVLSWPGASPPGTARLVLPAGLRWRLHRGETDPILGWYADGLGRRRPASTLVGTGLAPGQVTLMTRLEFHDGAEAR
ncbi:MAG: hypothetical protein ACRDNZ_23095, partial [Streptosporangiaceae bacterium]